MPFTTSKSIGTNTPIYISRNYTFKLIGIVTFIVGFHLFLSSSCYLHTSLQSKANYQLSLSSNRNPLFSGSNIDFSGAFNPQPPQFQRQNPPTISPIQRGRNPSYSNPASTAGQAGQSQIPPAGVSRDTYSALIYNDILYKVELQIGTSAVGIVLSIFQCLASIAFVFDPIKYYKLWIIIILIGILTSLICFAIAFNSYEEYILQLAFSMFYFSAMYINLIFLTGTIVFVLLTMKDLQPKENDPQV